MLVSPLRVLHLSASNASFRLERIDDPSLLGPLDLALWLGADGSSTVFGSGPFVDQQGLSWLVAAGLSPGWGCVLPDFLGPVGPAWRSLGLDALVLHGRAPGPCCLELLRSRAGFRAYSLPLGSRPWAGLAGAKGTDSGSVGVDALQEWLLDNCRGGPGCMALLAGPAAELSEIGSLRTRVLGAREGEEGQPRLLAGRGGLGSRLVRVHGVHGLVLGEQGLPAPLPFLQKPGQEDGSFPDLPCTNLQPMREWLSFFNGRSIYFPRAAREELYELLIARSLLSQIEASAQPTTLLPQCGSGCERPCQGAYREYRRSDEPLLALGPQLGVFDLDSVEALIRFVDVLGLDLLEGAGLVAWLMECMDSGWLDPADLGAFGRPRWDPESIDPQEDSEYNAALAGAVLEHLFLQRESVAEPRPDLRAAATTLGGRAGEVAAYLAQGDRGWLAPSPVWSPDSLVPLALPVRSLLHDRYEYLPPDELGRRAGRWLVVELAMANLGICPEHRPWAIRGGLEQAAVQRGCEVSCEEHHRRVARELEQALQHGPWSTVRVQDTLLRYLLQAQLSLVPDPDLDRWVARMLRDREEACDRYFAEIRGGVLETLGK